MDDGGAAWRRPLAAADPGAAARGDEALAADAELLFHVDGSKRCKARALLLGDHKLVAIEHNYEGLENVLRLYNLRTDPGETVDLATDQPQRVAEMLRRLEARTVTLAAQALVGGQNVLADMDREALEALGYL